MLIICQPGFCDYHSIAKAHFLLKNYEFGAHFLELDLEHNENTMSKFGLADVLESLYTCQVRIGNHAEASNTLNRMLHLLPLLIDATIPDTYSNLEVLSSVASTFRANGRIDEAKQLEKRQIVAIKEMNSSETHREESFAERAATLATALFEAEQYEDVPYLAECALNILKKQGNFPQKIVELELIIGKAEYYSGKKNASIESLKLVARSVVNEQLPFHRMAREACRYLMAQSHLDATCLLLVWNDLKDFGYNVLMYIIYVDIITYASRNEHTKTFSTDIAPSSAYLDILPSELETPAMFVHAILNWFIQTMKYYVLFIADVVLRISFILRILTFVGKLFILFQIVKVMFNTCFVCCCRPVYFLLKSLKRFVCVIFRKCIRA